MDYHRLDRQELARRKAKAKWWLQQNQNHPRYQEAKDRYAEICRILNDRYHDIYTKGYKLLTPEDMEWLDINI